MNWNKIWMSLFGTFEWLGLNIGFWVSMAVVVIIVILINVVFWSMKPKKYASGVGLRAGPISFMQVKNLIRRNG